MDAKSGANIKTAKLSVGDKNWSFPDLRRNDRTAM